MSYSEFPHYNDCYNGDLKELIELYKTLTGKYSQTLEMIQAVNTRLDEYIASQDAQLAQWRVEQQQTLNAAIASMREEFDVWKGNTLAAVANEVDAKTAELSIRQSNLERDTAKLSSDFSELNSNVNNYTLFVSNAMDSIRTEMSQEDAALRGELVLGIATNRAEMKQEISASEARIMEELAKLQCVSNEEAIRWLWSNAVGANSFTAYEWYMCSTISCEEWNESQITALEWHNDSRQILSKYCEPCLLSPLSGEPSSIQKIVNELAAAMKKCSVTACEYDAMGIKAGEYDAMLIPAYNYDMEGRRILHE